MKMSSHYGRRKQKQPEYEPIPVIHSPEVPPLEVKPRVDTEVIESKVPPKPAPEKILTNDNVKTDGFNEIVEGVIRRGENYPKPRVIHAPKSPEAGKIRERPAPTASAVLQEEPVVRAPIDEALPGWGRVFSGKQRKVAHT